MSYPHYPRNGQSLLYDKPHLINTPRPDWQYWMRCTDCKQGWQINFQEACNLETLMADDRWHTELVCWHCRGTNVTLNHIPTVQAPTSERGTK